MLITSIFEAGESCLTTLHSFSPAYVVDTDDLP